MQEACAESLAELLDGLQCQAATDGGAANSPSCVLVVEGSTLDFALQGELQSHFLELSGRCKAVLCCRSTPLQKSQVVQLLREKLGVMTLAVGRTLLPSTAHSTNHSDSCTHVAS